jgi:hypothetical protein
MSGNRLHDASTQWNWFRQSRRQWLLTACFASAMLLVGLVLAYAFVLHPVRLVWSARHWVEVPCTIISSKVEDDGEEYDLQIVYRYEFAGQAHQSERYHVVESWSTGDSGMKAIADRYPPGRPARCYVDPADPVHAALNRSFTANPAAWILGGLFAVLPVATGGLWWFMLLSRKAHPNLQTLAGLAFFLQFFAGGLFLSYGFLIGPASRVLQARNWVQVPCTVVSSEVKAKDDDEYFRVHIVFDYEFDGQAYQSARYNFVWGHSTNYAGKKLVVDRYPPGHKTHCYVNPADPTQAVINRSIAFEMLVGVFPLMFTFFLAIVLVWGLRNWIPTGSPEGAKPAGEAGVAMDDQHDETGDRGSMILKPEPSPFVRFLVAMVGISVWTGIFAGMMRLAIDEFRLGWSNWFLIVLLAGFLLLGRAILTDAVYELMRVFSPRPTLTLSTGRIAPGDTVGLTWTFSGNGRAIRYLRIELEGKQEFADRNGRETRAEKMLHLQLLVDTMNPAHIATGQTEFTVPAWSLHSIETDEYQVVWALNLTARGETELWPRVDETYPFPVSSRLLEAAI